MAYNANGIAGQSNELEMILYERKIDILLINETHLKEKDKFRLTNYIIYRNDRKDGPMGGTAICVKNGIGHRVASIPNLHFIEITGIYLPVDTNKEIFIGSVYKSPSKLLTTHDLDILTQLSDQYLLAGDFNAKHLAWGCFAQNPSWIKKGVSDLKHLFKTSKLPLKRPYIILLPHKTSLLSNQNHIQMTYS